LLQATLRRSPLGLVEAVAESHLPEDTNLLVVVDQFEELFRFRTQSKNLNDADAFVSLLLASAQSGPSEVPIYVVITMRSDFIGVCALFSGGGSRVSPSVSALGRRRQASSAEDGSRSVAGRRSPERTGLERARKTN
jgi:hypothetical protein